VCCVPIHIDIK